MITWNATGSLQQATELLVSQANLNGGRDNISVGLVKIIKLHKKHENSWFNPLS